MSSFQLLLRSLLYYWRTNLAVLLGVVAGTAVIGGALVVGDSVRGSLETMSRQRLGEIDHALSGFRFFREELAADLAARPEFQKRFHAGDGADGLTVAPAIAMVGAVERELPAEEADIRYARAGQVNVWGLDERLWQMTEHGDFARPTGDEVILSSRLAEQLGVTGREEDRPTVTLWIELPSTIPRDSLLGDREQQVSVRLDLQVKAVLPERSGVGRLELNPTQQLPLGAFLDLDTLQQALGLAADRIRDPVRRRIIEVPARVNSLFVAARSVSDSEGATAPEAAEALNDMLQEIVTLDDLGLRVLANEEQNYLSLESDQQILADAFVDAGDQAAEKLDWATSPVLVYIANELRNADESEVRYRTDEPDIDRTGRRGYAMYSVVAGLEFPQPEPLKQFSFIGERPKFPLGPRQIVLTDWLAEDLKVEVGDEVVMRYYTVGAHVLDEEGNLPQQTRTFTVAGIVRADEGSPALDGGLVPEVPGVTDADTFDEIKEPFPLQRDLVTERDEIFWDQHQATPKAFVSLDTAQELWTSRYGRLTSLRIVPDQGVGEASGGRQPAVSSEMRNDESGEDNGGLTPPARQEFTAAYLKSFEPRSIGMAFRPVKYQGLKAAGGTTDFTGLFIGFSFFLILSATILIGLLFRLGVDRRVENVGLLEAVGFTPARVRRQFLLEGLLVVLIGGLLGVAAAVGYAELMIYGLKTWWIGAIGTRFLDVYINPLSLLWGFLGSAVVAGLTIWWALRQLKKISTRSLLSGVSERELSTSQKRSRGRWALVTAVGGAAISLVVLIAALAGLVPASELSFGISWQAVAFFVVGVLMLTASVAFLYWYTAGDHGMAVRGAGLAGTGRLGVRNVSRNRTRSGLTVGLIASATFVIVAVAAGHRNPAAETPDKDSGNGGFVLVAESSTPILYDLGTAAGRAEVGLPVEVNEAAYRNDPEGLAEAKRQAAEQNRLLDEMTIVPFRVKPGENASCLNLYQTRLPTMLGVPQRMIERGGFKFVGAERDNPWTLLEAGPEKVKISAADDSNLRIVPAYPVFGDMNTLQYSLHKGVGELIPVPDADTADHALKIVGQFDGSVFQGVLLMSETNFNRLYPQQAGYNYFLIEAPPESADELQNLLETRLHDYGFDAEPVGKRLQSFLEVQNTYLSTFQALGGLGLLLGTLGLATVMLRNVIERRGELALLRSVGFSRSRLAWLVVAENAFLLLWGLAAGTVSALVAMAPHLTTTGADVPWDGVALILGGVFIIGTLAALLAVAEAVRTPILSTLRAE